MELELSSGESQPQKSNSSNDMVSNIERAMENPQIKGMVAAILQNQGINPSQFGMTVPNQNEKPQLESSNPSQMPEENTQSEEKKLDSTNIVQMIDEIANQSPMGYNTTLKMVKQHIEGNPEQINQVLENSGLR